MTDTALMLEGQEDLTWDRWFRFADAAESLGFEGLFRSDHLTALNREGGREAPALWPSLTTLATRTSRVRFGPAGSRPSRSATRQWWPRWLHRSTCSPAADSTWGWAPGGSEVHRLPPGDVHQPAFRPGRLARGGFLVGSPAQIVDQIGSRVEAGVSRFMLQPNALDDLESVELIAGEVLPQT